MKQSLMGALINRRIQVFRARVDFTPQIVRRMADMPHLGLFIGFLLLKPDGHAASLSAFLCLVNRRHTIRC